MVLGNLTNVREKHSFDTNNLDVWLEKNIKGFGKIFTIKQFIGGQSNPTFFINSDKGAEIILRKKPPGKLLPSAHAVEREYKVQKSLMSTKVPCPSMLALCEDSNIIGTSFYIMECVEGVIYESILDVKSINKRKSIFLQMVQMLANLHNIDYEKVDMDY